MDLITIDKEQLKELFVEAYEAGWYGSKELAGSTADDLVKKAAGVNAWKSDWDESPEEELRVEYVTPPTLDTRTFTLNPGDYDAPEVDIPPPQTIEIQQDGQAVQIAGWEVRWPPVGSSFIFRDDVGTSEE